MRNLIVNVEFFRFFIDADHAITLLSSLTIMTSILLIYGLLKVSVASVSMKLEYQTIRHKH